MNDSTGTIFSRLPPWVGFSCHLIMLLLISLFAFMRNPSMLLMGNDGPTGFSLADEELTFFGITPHLHSNLLEGLANTSLSYNLTVQPGYWYGAFVHGGTFAIALIYIWFSFQLFMSVLLIGWNYRFPVRVSYAAAWLLTLLAFPYFESFRIYSITASMPNFIGIILVFAIMDIGIQRMGADSWFKTFYYGLILLLGFTIGLMTCPALLILLVPMLLLSTCASFINVVSRAEFLRKLTMALAILIFIIAAGWLAFLTGLILNTAGIFFNGEMHASGVDTSSLVYLSILFHGNSSGMSLGPWLFFGSVFGILVAIWKSPKLRKLGFTILLAQILIPVGGLLAFKVMPNLASSVSPIYFEIILFPFYALFAAYFIDSVFHSIPGVRRISRLPDVVFLLMLAVIIAACLMSNLPKNENVGNFAVLPASTSITDVLEKEIAVRKHADFTGRVANIVTGKNWIDQMQYFSSINAIAGNDHQSTGLWLKHIPTLHEYSQTISPGFYRIYRRFLSDGTDHPYRSWSNFNKVDLKILKLLGVRFIISTSTEINDTIQRAKLTLNENTPTLYLYELKEANIAGISADRVIAANNLHNAEDLMAANDFNLHDAIVVDDKKLNNQLVPVTSSKIRIVQGGLQLEATSNGTSLLILPIEYSHCLYVTPRSGVAPQVVRVDVALAGIVFNRFVYIKIDNRTGPFANPRCRWKDYREFAKLWKN